MCDSLNYGVPQESVLSPCYFLYISYCCMCIRVYACLICNALISKNKLLQGILEGFDLKCNIES